MIRDDAERSVDEQLAAVIAMRNEYRARIASAEAVVFGLPAAASRLAGEGRTAIRALRAGLEQVEAQITALQAWHNIDAEDAANRNYADRLGDAIEQKMRDRFGDEWPGSN